MMRTAMRPSDFRSFWEVMPVMMVMSTMGTTIILMQLSQMVPMNSSLTMTPPKSRPKTAPRIMAEKTCVLRPIFLPTIFIRSSFSVV